MTIITADSTIASYIKALASEKLSDGVEKLKCGTIPSVMRVHL